MAGAGREFTGDKDNLGLRVLILSHRAAEGLGESCRGSKKSPQDVPLWYVDCFEPKATKTLWAQEKCLPLLTT